VPKTPSMSAYRALPFAVCAAFILLAPAYPELVNSKIRWLPDWRMFVEPSASVLEVRFEVQDGPKRRELDRFAALGHGSFAKSPRSVRLLTSVSVAWSVARTLCGKGFAPLYMRVRRPSANGWRVLVTGDSDACTRTPGGGAPRESP
jgi:hypothetical protein